jgi:ribosomal protein S18 acetylase RimI-like enzyme
VLDELPGLNVMVDEAEHCRAIGSALVSAVVSEARARSWSAILLEQRAGSEADRSRYAGRRFVVAGTRPRYYPDGEGALLMTLSLRPDTLPGVAPVAEPHPGRESDRGRTHRETID